MKDAQFSGTSFKVNENHLHPEENRSITVETSAGFSSTFKLVPENCVFYIAIIVQSQRYVG